MVMRDLLAYSDPLGSSPVFTCGWRGGTAQWGIWAVGNLGSTAWGGSSAMWKLGPVI